MHGGHLLKAYSKTQVNIALSCGEAEFYSMMAASSEALGLKAMTQDYEHDLDPWLYVDASAAIGVAQRMGLGKICHLETQSLWLQEAVRKRKIGVIKVKGTENPVELMTKFTDFATTDKLCSVVGLVIKTGRAASAPKIATSVQAVCHGDVGEAAQTHRGREDHHAQEHPQSMANTPAPVTEEHGGTEKFVGAFFVVGNIGGSNDRVLVDFKKRTSRNEESEERRKDDRDGKSFLRSRSLSSTGTSAQALFMLMVSATTYR